MFIQMDFSIRMVLFLNTISQCFLFISNVHYKTNLLVSIFVMDIFTKKLILRFTMCLQWKSAFFSETCSLQVCDARTREFEINNLGLVKIYIMFEDGLCGSHRNPYSWHPIILKMDFFWTPSSYFDLKGVERAQT